MRDSTTEIPQDIAGIAYIKDDRLIKSTPRNNLYDLNGYPIRPIISLIWTATIMSS